MKITLYQTWYNKKTLHLFSWGGLSDKDQRQWIKKGKIRGIGWLGYLNANQNNFESDGKNIFRTLYGKKVILV